MNEFKGTPGPWKRDKYGHVVDERGRDINFRSMSSLCSGSEERMAEAEANTTLASAAPDLLAALQGVLRVADRATDEFDAARAAISKALGK
jgi:hypothetical protein